MFKERGYEENGKTESKKRGSMNRFHELALDILSSSILNIKMYIYLGSRVEDYHFNQRGILASQWGPLIEILELHKKMDADHVRNVLAAQMSKGASV